MDQNPEEDRPSVLGFVSFLFILGYIILTIASTSGPGELEPVDAGSLSESALP